MCWVPSLWQAPFPLCLHHQGWCLCPNLSLMSLLAKGNFLLNLLFTPTLEIQVTIIPFLYQYLALFHKVPMVSVSLLRCSAGIYWCETRGGWKESAILLRWQAPFHFQPAFSCLPEHNTIKRNRLMVTMAFSLLHYPGAAETMSVTYSCRRNSATA